MAVQPGEDYRAERPNRRDGQAREKQLARKLAQATRAYEADRYREAAAILREVLRIRPGSASARELYGLTLYRQGRWRDAIRQLHAFVELTGSFDQHPVLADCYRARGRYEEAEALWNQLRRASPSAEVLSEGRIVAAGARADRGDIKGAIALMERARLNARDHRLHKLRETYVLADLYERAGDLPRARQLFRRVAASDPELTDAPQRLAGLG